LGPYEEFTVLSLSGSTPKRENFLKIIAVRLDNVTTTDIVMVETMDKKKYSIKLKYFWFFNVDRSNLSDDGQKLFSCDFIGYLCGSMASRIRGAVASVKHEEFSENVGRFVRRSIFGVDQDGRTRSNLLFFCAFN